MGLRGRQVGWYGHVGRKLLGMFIKPERVYLLASGGVKNHSQVSVQKV